MGDLLIHNVQPWVLEAVKAEAHRHGRSISDQAQVIIIRRLARDGDLPPEEAAELLGEFNATLAEGT